MTGDSPRAFLDLQLWPIAIFSVRDGMQEAEYNAVFERYESDVFTRRERYVSITDLSTMNGVPNAYDRKHMAEWMGKHEAYVSRWAIGNSTVIRSPLVRGALTALYWIQKPPTAQTSHATVSEAVHWAVEALVKEGLTPPVGVESWLRQHEAA